MNEVTIKGEVKFVDEVREYGANGFRKQEVVVETGDGKWDNPIAVEFTKDNIEKSQTLKKGDRVTIEARVNGREWQGRDGVTKWIHGWKRNGWKTAAKKPVKNADLWQELDAETARHTVNWHWVKGHSGHPENERADQLANEAILSKE